jgi:PadR family transcriptional regulator, regulatory protein PadR
MRRKPGTLVPLELAICRSAVELQQDGVREFHGYEMAKKLAAETDHQSLAAYGTLYRALGRLQDMGLLKSRWEDPRIAAAESRPSRRLYTLTAAGRSAAHEARNAVLAKAAKRARKGWAPA